MDQVLIDCYIQVSRGRGYSIEKIERIPEFHSQYVNLVRQHCDWDDERIFNRATNLRRAGKLPKSRELAKQSS